MHFNRPSRRLTALAAFAAATLTAAADTDAPPAFADAEHVFHGCHLSSLAYLNRFTAEFPSERGEVVVLLMNNADGARREHTIALVTWKNEWFGRDEYFGVFRLKANVDAHPSAERLVARASTVLSRLSSRLCTTPAYRSTDAYRRPPMKRGTLSPAELLREVSVAARIVPYASTTYWLKEGSREYPVLFFRPAAGVIAVYDPHRGTSVAECASPDNALVVGLVAARLGYAAGYVRTEVLASAR